jgi:hypothetical protein
VGTCPKVGPQSAWVYFHGDSEVAVGSPTGGRERSEQPMKDEPFVVRERTETANVWACWVWVGSSETEQAKYGVDQQV